MVWCLPESLRIEWGDNMQVSRLILAYEPHEFENGIIGWWLSDFLIFGLTDLHLWFTFSEVSRNLVIPVVEEVFYVFDHEVVPH